MGFVATALALTPCQLGRGVDPSRRELVGERPSRWIKAISSGFPRSDIFLLRKI
jgi:hypothetical protein